MSLESLKEKVGLLIEKAQNGGSTDELEAIIDNSGVLDSTDGTVEEKVEQLVNKAEDESLFYIMTERLLSVGDLFMNWEFEKIPRINPIKATKASHLCENAKKLKRIDFYIDTRNVTDLNTVFKGCIALEYVKGINTAKSQWVTDMFTDCTVLKTVEEPFDLSKCLTSSSGMIRMSANGCELLETIRFVPETIQLNFFAGTWKSLSAESIQSIIDGLATVETAQTLTLHKDVKAKLTETQLATITGKNWSLA